MNKTKPKYLKVNLKLQKRDRDILSYIHKFRVTTIAQIHKALFKGKKRITCFRRVRMLQSAKYLKCHYLNYRGQNIYLITVQGCAAIGVLDQSLKKKGSGLRVYNSQIPHDLTLIDVANALKELPYDTSYLSENEIRAKLSNRAKYISDGALIIRNPVKAAFGIEVELSLKSPSRYIQKFSDMSYGLKDPFIKYLYIIDDIELRHFFIKQAKCVFDRALDDPQHIIHHLLFVELEDLISNVGQCFIYTTKGKKIRLVELFERIIKHKFKKSLRPPIIKSKFKNKTF